MSTIIKRDLPRILIFILGFIVAFSYFIDVTEISDAVSTLTSWTVVIAAWTLLPATVVLLITNTRNVVKRVPEQWYTSIVFIIFFVVTAGFGLIYTTADTTFSWLFTNIGVAGYSTMMATTALYVVSAAYRAFRARTWEATILLTVAILVMFGNMTAMEALWPGFVPLRDWLNTTGSATTMRALKITIGVGLIGILFRTLVLGYERRGAAEE